MTVGLQAYGIALLVRFDDLADGRKSDVGPFDRAMVRPCQDGSGATLEVAMGKRGRLEAIAKQSFVDGEGHVWTKYQDGSHWPRFEVVPVLTRKA